MSDIPQGFEPIFRSSPFLDLIGPIYNRRTESEFVIGLRVEQQHCNARNLVHGGVFSSLADVALGYSLAFQNEEPVSMVTANLSIDYVGSAKLGEWIQVHTDIQKVGRSMAFANCYFNVGDRRIVRASGVFSVLGAKG